MAEKRTLNIGEVAELLGVNRNTVALAAKRGEIPHLRMGERVVFARAAIERFLETGSFAEPVAAVDPRELAEAVVREWTRVFGAGISAMVEVSNDSETGGAQKVRLVR